MSSLNRDEEIAVDKYTLLFNLWMSENSVKTNKLQMLMATNAILVAALTISQNPIGWIAVAGFTFSLVWVFSIGRTVAYQKRWQDQMEVLRTGFPTIPLFNIHSTKTKEPIWGRVPSRYYLLGTPIGTTLAWLVVIIRALVAGH